MRPGDFIKFRLFRPLLLKIGAGMGKYSTVGDKPVFDNKDFGRKLVGDPQRAGRYSCQSSTISQPAGHSKRTDRFEPG